VWVIGESIGPVDVKPYEAGIVVLAAMADFAVSSALVTLVISFTSGQSVKSVWYEKFRWLLPHFVLLGVLAFALDLGYETFGVWGIMAFIVPALMTRLSMKQYVDSTEKTVDELRASHAAVNALSVDLERAYSDTLHAIVAALDLRDTETQGHSTRVAELSLQIGRRLGIEQGTQEWRDLKHGAMLHDVGKIGVEDAILRKPGPLDENEWAMMRRHPRHGYGMLQDVPFLMGAAELVLSHHERYDGGGYPRGLKGEEIPLGARIFAVADTFDAITSPRPYKPGRSEEEAYREIEAHSGTQFDPRIVATFLQLKGRLQRAA
jgi:HD-GYP domain-containing protein (c-di-GMP phosphodiesterase class II)